MPKPTAAANATAMPVTTRRAFLKAVGALGTITALAVPVAVLPKERAAAACTAALTLLWPERLRLFNIHDCIFLAPDILDSPSPFPEEACELLREALAEMKALLDGKRQ